MRKASQGGARAVGLYQLLYASRSQLGATDADDAIGDILASAHRHNAQAGVTGALVYSGTHFVQLLEGEQAAVEAIFDRVARDPRHDDIDVVAAHPAAARMFAGWSMAYRGKTQYVQSHIDRLVGERDRVSVQAIERLMRECVAVGGVGVDALATAPELLPRARARHKNLATVGQ